MSISSEIDDFITANGGNVRDALNIALARLEAAKMTMCELRTELEAASRWIPVEERLPEKNEMVVVYVAAYGSVEIARHIPEIPQWTTPEGIYLHGESYDDITHWQPLPQPPEAQE